METPRGAKYGFHWDDAAYIASVSPDVLLALLNRLEVAEEEARHYEEMYWDNVD